MSDPQKDAPQRRIAIALIWGALCHGLFALGVGAMVVGMFFGMRLGLGEVSHPWSVLANAALLAQFPLVHSWLLTGRGRALLVRLGPAGYGGDLATTSYAAIASVQLLALFALWTPSGIVWFEATGVAFWTMSGLYALAWALLGKSMLDAGIQLQSGLLGWWAVLRNRKPRYPDMPATGLFRYIRQPIYATFALTLWTPPVWTPDQLALALAFTGYCVLAPRWKERRFERLFGERFARYRARTPYFLPRLALRRRDPTSEAAHDRSR